MREMVHEGSEWDQESSAGGNPINLLIVTCRTILIYVDSQEILIYSALCSFVTTPYDSQKRLSKLATHLDSDAPRQGQQTDQ